VILQDASAREARLGAHKTTRFVPQYMEEGQEIESRETSFKVMTINHLMLRFTMHDTASLVATLICI